MDRIIYKELGFDIIGVAMEVHRDLGSGFLEKVYENAMIVLFEERQIKAEQQKHLDLIYHNKNIGKYISDILVEDKIILELKTVENITGVHIAQVINYLKITNKKLGIIINFRNKKLEYKRVILD